MIDPTMPERDARVLATAARRTIDWLDDQRDVPALGRAVLTDTLTRIDQEAQALARAVTTRPRLALLAPRSEDIGRLIGALAAPRDGLAIGRFHGSYLRAPLLEGVCPAGALEGLGVILRVTHADSAQATGAATHPAVTAVWSDDPAPRPASAEAAITVHLLSLSDVLTILASAWMDTVSEPKRAATTPTPEAIEAVLREVAMLATGAAHADLSAANVRKVRADLDHRFAQHPRLQALAAFGFWDAFEHLAPKLPMEGRRRLAALLWDGAADVDALFGALGDLLDGLSHAGDVLCPPEAVREASSAPGFGRAHPQSILAAATALAIGATSSVTVRTRFGAAVTVERALLALVAAQADVSVEGDATAVLATRDLCVLPTACPAPAPVPWHVSAPMAPRSDPDQPHWLPAAAVAAKTRHLAHRVLAEADTTGLVVHVDARAELSPAFAPTVSTWVRQAHGMTPAEREAREPTLVVSVSAATAQSATARKAWAGLDPLANDPGSLDSWVHRWSPDRPFDNVVLIGGEDTRLPLEMVATLPVRLAEASGTTLPGHTEPRANSWAPHVRDRTGALEEALHARDGGLGYLMQVIGAIDPVRARRWRVDARLSDLAHAATAGLARFVGAADIALEQDRRSRAAQVVHARLRRVAETQRLGALIADLGLTTHAAQHVVDRLGAEPAIWDDPFTPTVLTTPAATDLAARYARAVLGVWARQLTHRAGDVMHAAHLGLTPGVLQTLVEEVVVAAVRTDLEATLTGRVARALTRTPVTRARAGALSALIAAETVGAFVSELSFDGPWSASRPKRRGTLGAPLFERRSAGTAQALAAVDPDRIVAQFSTDWLEAWLAMVEANLAFARGLRLEGRTQRDLEDLVALFMPNVGTRRP